MQAEPKLRIDRKIQLKLLHTHEITLQRRHVSSQKKKKSIGKSKESTTQLQVHFYFHSGNIKRRKKKKGRFPSKQNEE